MNTPEFDGAQAEAEGWGIFECDGSDNGPWQICRIDEQEKLESDDEAWQLVARRAREGSEYHLGAIAYVREHNPQEFVAFCKFTGWGQS